MSSDFSWFSNHTQPIPVYCVHPAPVWAPLALGMILAYAQKMLPAEQYDTSPYFVKDEQELEALIQEHGPGVCLFSNYMWTCPDNLRISKWVKAHSPQTMTIHGGPDTPVYPGRCEAFLNENPHVDFAVRGEGETTVADLLAYYQTSTALPESVPGLSFLKDGQLIQTPPRARSEDLSVFPSPYLTGIFDGIKDNWLSLTIETNRGCPYGCTFCDWGSATLQKIRKFDMERIFQEIEWIGKNEVAEIWIADANFGIFPRDVEVTHKICEVKQKYGFPKRITVNYAKNTKKYLVDIVESLTDAGLIGVGIMSLQTRDETTLKAVNRTNIKTREYDKLKEVFARKKLPLSTQLMIGLPGSTRESFKEDLRYFFYQDVDVQIFRTVVLPNSPMAHPDYLEKYKVTFDDKGLIIANSTLPAQEINHMEHLARLYRTAHNFGILRYWLSFLHWDYQIDPIEFLDQLTEHLATLPEDALLAKFYDKESPAHDLLNSHIPFREHMRSEMLWADFYQELKTYTLSRHPEVNSAELDILCQVQTAIMPEAGRNYPVKLELPHDFAAYFKAQHQDSDNTLPLRDFEPATFEVEDPLNLSDTPLPKLFYTKGFPRWIWELYSPLNYRLEKELKILPTFHKVS